MRMITAANESSSSTTTTATNTNIVSECYVVDYTNHNLNQYSRENLEETRVPQHTYRTTQLSTKLIIT
jgi:hypothetical protein